MLSGMSSDADPEPIRLVHGPYLSPPFRPGARVRCELRGEVEMVALSDSAIAWPLGRPVRDSRRAALIVYGGLARVVRLESATEVRCWWGVNGGTGTRWRKALGVRGGGHLGPDRLLGGCACR
jgi:hypothetical protein